MMRLLALVGGVAVGALLGLGLRGAGLSVDPARPAPASGPERVRQVLVPAEKCDEEARLMHDITRLAEQLELTEREVAVARAQTEAEIGPAQEWPSDLDPVFTEAGIEEGLLAILDDIGAGQLVGLDCGEYPCIGVVAFAGDEVFADRDAFGEHLRDSAYGESFHKSETLLQDDETGAMTLAATIAFPAVRPDALPAQTRQAFRMDDAWKTFGADVKALSEPGSPEADPQAP